MRLLLLGESPNEATAHRPELWLLPDDSGIPHSANRLLRLTGYTEQEFHCTFPVRDNLLHHLPERHGRGRAFPRAMASACGARVTEACMSRGLDGIIVLGRRLSRVFDWHSGLGGDWIRGDVPYFQGACLRPIGATEVTWVSAYVVPHPSGVNQFWNYPRNRAQAAAFFASIKESHDRRAHRTA